MSTESSTSTFASCGKREQRADVIISSRSRILQHVGNAPPIFRVKRQIRGSAFQHRQQSDDHLRRTRQTNSNQRFRANVSSQKVTSEPVGEGI